MNRFELRSGAVAALALCVTAGALAVNDDPNTPTRSRFEAERPQLERSQNTVSTPQIRANAPSAMTAAGGIAIDCGCGDYSANERVYAIVESIEGSGLPLHARGRVISGDSDFPDRILVEWEDWDGGHNGGPGSAQPECPPLELEGNARWWVRCTDLARFETVDCVCDGIYRVGDRVAALVDEPNNATGVLAGRTGSVVSGYSSGLPLLIEWDNWAEGHGGNGFTECPPNESDTAMNRWWTDCENVTPIETQSTAWCACDAEYSVGDEVEIVIPEFEGADLQVGDRGIVVAGRESGSFEGGLILVEFLAWEGGHDGISPAGRCPELTLEGNSRWYLPCDYIKPAVCNGDLNGDGTVNGADLAILLGGFGDCN